MLRFVVALISAAVCLAQTGQPEACCGPAAIGTRVELAGTVAAIHIVAGEGSPYFELKHGDATARVFLGPMPYLIAENFNLKAGQEVVVKGFRVEDRVLAMEVTLVAEKRTVRFRDQQGRPLWRGGFGRGRRR